MKEIQAVIFDFGGVFTSSPVEEFFKFEQTHKLPEKFLGGVIKTNHQHNAWARFERGEINQIDFNQAFSIETAAAGYEVSGDILLSLLSLSLKPVMVAALATIKQAGFKTGCITNNLPNMDSKSMLSDSADVAAADDIFAQFDHVIESSKVGIRKPEPIIYTMMCEALSVQPAQCVFLDDLGINLKPAQAMGMHTIKVPFGDVTPAVEELFALLELN
jgi:putative hydrolase of the HAD superfamily